MAELDTCLGLKVINNKIIKHVNTGDIRWGRPSYLKIIIYLKKIQKDGYIGLPLNTEKFIVK